MNNKIKSSTRLTFIQIIFQNLSTQNDLDEILTIFNEKYKSTSVVNLYDKQKFKFQFNSNFLKKLINFYKKFTSSSNYLKKINHYIFFDRKFERWDLINQSILLAILSELGNVEKSKITIILNDYLNISKYFVSQSDVAIINAVIDKLINEKN